MAEGRYDDYRRALSAESLPAALVDLDAVDRNLRTLLTPVRQSGKRLRLATKSLRCPELIRYLVEHSDGLIASLMAYTVQEAAYLVAQGHHDLLVAYPTLQPADARLLAESNRHASVAIVVDSLEHLPSLVEAATRAAVRVPLVIDIDVAYRPFSGVHLGVRRSPLRQAGQVSVLIEAIAELPSLELVGLMAYEAQIAGLTDTSPFDYTGPIKRWLKRRMQPALTRQRAELKKLLAADALFNGGGSGSLSVSSRDPALTELTAGSGFLASHLFDCYAGLKLEPALFFALQVVRRPAANLVTCHGGGFVASGAAGRDRLPIPWLPSGLELLAMEGAGEVQTPLKVPSGTRVELGDPVLFRPAKAGELAEHFNHYLLVRGDRVVSRAATYRGLGQVFLG